MVYIADFLFTFVSFYPVICLSDCLFLVLTAFLYGHIFDSIDSLSLLLY